jgi:ElaB/YqjD/DUF883 family membrane-anchored ribosome-binding protein
MAVAETGATDVVQHPPITDRIADAVRHATHLSHEARLVTSLARDAGEEGVHAAKHLLKRVRRTAEHVEDLKDDAAYYVKRRPFEAVGIAASVGLLLGIAVGWIGGRFGQRRGRDSSEE